MHLPNSYRKVIIKVAGTPLPKTIGLRSPIGYITDLTLSKKETGKLSIRIGTGVEKLRSSDPHVIITEKFREIFLRHEKVRS